MKSTHDDPGRKNTSDKADRLLALDFLRAHVIGRSVASAPVTTSRDEGRLEAVYQDQTFYSNLIETADGFSFDLTDITRGQLYDLDNAGKRRETEGLLDTVRVVRYEMTQRRSSGRLVGFARFVTSTNSQPDPFSGSVFLVRMWRDGAALMLVENQVGYADAVTAGGKFKPIAMDGAYRYAVEDGKLVVHYEQSTFDVDPATLQRTPTKDRFPVQVSREVGFPVSVAVGA